MLVGAADMHTGHNSGRGMSFESSLRCHESRVSSVDRALWPASAGIWAESYWPITVGVVGLRGLDSFEFMLMVIVGRIAGGYLSLD